MVTIIIHGGHNMKWEGLKLKELAKNKRLSLQNLAEGVGISGQTVNDWIKGQVPKGNHLLLLCKLLDINPKAFFLTILEITFPFQPTGSG